MATVIVRVQDVASKGYKKYQVRYCTGCLVKVEGGLAGKADAQRGQIKDVLHKHVATVREKRAVEKKQARELDKAIAALAAADED